MPIEVEVVGLLNNGEAIRLGGMMILDEQFSDFVAEAVAAFKHESGVMEWGSGAYRANAFAGIILRPVAKDE